MRIAFLSTVHTPQDKRVFFKEALSLREAGFEVFHVAPGSAELCYRDRDIAIVTYVRGPGLRGRLRALPILLRHAKAVGADCIHCNEVDSWFVGLILKVLYRKVIIFDVHEHFPSVFAERHVPKLLKPVAAAGVRAVFRVLGPMTDRIVFAKRTVVNDFGGLSDRKVLVQNFAARPANGDKGVHRNCQARSGIVAIHVGLFGQSRGWPQLLDALTRTATPVRAQVLGTIDDGTNDLFDRTVRDLGLVGRVEVRTWLPPDIMMDHLRRADVGLVLFQPGIQNHTFALPHKLFDYMAAGLPVLVPDFAVEVAGIVTEHNCGILVDPSDPESIALALDRLAGDPVLRCTMGQRGREAVRERYNWEREAEKLVAMYRAIDAELTEA